MTETTTTTTTGDLELRREPAALARPNLDREVTDSWVDVIRPVVSLSEHVASTSFVPKGLRDNAPAVAAAILHGRELGLPPMTSLAQTHVIEGKPTLSAEGLRALVLAAGHDVEVTETTGSRCTMRGRRRGSSTWTEITWTIDQARAANLTNKDNWRRHPRQMLQARASSELCRLVFPDVCHGMGAAEELADELEGDGTAGASTEQPSTAVSRTPRQQRRTTTPRQVAPAPAPSTSAAPLEVDVPMPDAPAPSGPAGDADPGPEDGAEGTGQAALTDEQVVEQAAAEAPERDEPAQVVEHTAPKVTPAQLRMLGVTWGKLGVGDDDRRNYTEALIGRRLEGGTTKDLTKREATRLIDQLVKVETLDQLDDLVTAALTAQGAES